MNQLSLAATIAERAPLRYTPAGVPALDAVLAHASEATEAGQSRRVELSIRAQAFGTVAEALALQALGTALAFNGFLAASRNGKGLVFHIQAFQPI